MLSALRASVEEAYLGSARSSGKISLERSDLGLDLLGADEGAPPRREGGGAGTAPTVKPLGLPAPIDFVELEEADLGGLEAEALSSGCVR
jgi:hypothetical protein